jgi:hypothetical protein
MERRYKEYEKLYKAGSRPFLCVLKRSEEELYCQQMFRNALKSTIVNERQRSKCLWLAEKSFTQCQKVAKIKHQERLISQKMLDDKEGFLRVYHARFKTGADINTEKLV